MRPSRRTPTHSDLRLSILFSEQSATPARLMNLEVPERTLARIHALAAERGCTKTEAVVALLNEGLDAFEARRGEFPAALRGTRKRRGRPAKHG